MKEPCKRPLRKQANVVKYDMSGEQSVWDVVRLRDSGPTLRRVTLRYILKYAGQPPGAASLGALLYYEKLPEPHGETHNFLQKGT